MNPFNSRYSRLGLLGLGIVAGAAGVGLSGRARSADLPVYRPTISDLMTAAIQPRHIKLWLAGNAGNWDYADYEARNLAGALGRVAAALPNYQDVPTAELLSDFAKPQLEAVEAAVKAKDERAFASAYDGLTLGCNQCHQATGHALVVIQDPGSNPFPDQDFRPRSN